MDKEKYKEVGVVAATDKMWFDKENPVKVGQTIEGRYVAKNEGVGANKSNIYVLEVGEERVGVWGSTVLDTKFSQIAEGKMVGIEYLGEVTGKSNRAYKDFWVGQGIDAVGDEDAQ